MSELTYTVSIIEALASLICVIGIGICARGLWSSLRLNKERIRQGLNGRLKISHHGRIRLYALALTKIMLYTQLAFGTALLPPRSAPLNGWQLPLSRVIGFTAPFAILANVVLLILILDGEQRDRTHLEKTDRQIHREKRDRLRQEKEAATKSGP